VNFLRLLDLQEKKKLDDNSRLGVVEIARVPDMLPSLFPFLVGLRIYQHPGRRIAVCEVTRYPPGVRCLTEA